MKLIPYNIAKCIVDSIRKACQEYEKRATGTEGLVLPPEYFFNVRIYDALWKEFKGVKTLGGITGEFMITLEEHTVEVKKAAGKRGSIAQDISSGNGVSRHDVTLWLGDSPTCVIEVKLIGYKYGVLTESFKADFKRLKSAVTGKTNTVKCGILAVYDGGYSVFDETKYEKHRSAIEQEFSNSAVQVGFKWAKINVEEHDEGYMAGAICVTSK